VDQSLDLAEAQRSRMERILRGIGECLVVTDPDGQIRLMNKLAEEALGVSESLAFGRDLFGEQRDESFRTKWRAFIDGSGERDRALWEKGDGRVYLATFSRIRTAEGRPAGCVAVMADATQERQADRVKRDFVANLTNELRTPLASIRGFIGTVLRGENRTRENDARFLLMIEKECERLQQLLEDLRSLASLEAGGEPLDAKSADFVEILRQANATFESTARERSVALEMRGGDENGSGVFDAEKIRRVLDNLVGNALKFTQAGGSVTVWFRRDGNRLECAVRDTGPGIEPHRLEGLFDRLDSVAASTGSPWGTGLGLHVARGLVQLHGGEIVAESRLGEGSTFRFWIPEAPPTNARGVAASANPSPIEDPLVDDPDPAESFFG
jgi:PAS domain S-box-containing protein